VSCRSGKDSQNAEDAFESHDQQLMDADHNVVTSVAAVYVPTITRIRDL